MIIWYNVSASDNHISHLLSKLFGSPTFKIWVNAIKTNIFFLKQSQQTFSPRTTASRGLLRLPPPCQMYMPRHHQVLYFSVRQADLGNHEDPGTLLYPHYAKPRHHFLKYFQRLGLSEIQVHQNSRYNDLFPSPHSCPRYPHLTINYRRFNGGYQPSLAYSKRLQLDPSIDQGPSSNRDQTSITRLYRYSSSAPTLARISRHCNSNNGRYSRSHILSG